MLRFTSVVSVVGVAIGVGGLIVAQAVGNGFEREVKETILLSTAHISIRRADGGELSDFKGVQAKVSQIEGVVEVRNETFAPAVVFASDVLQSENVVLHVTDRDDVPSGTIAMGDRLRQRLPSGESLFSLQIHGARDTVALKSYETFSTGIFEYDSTQVRISRADFARLRGVPEFVPSVLSVQLADLDQVEEAASRIRQSLGPGFDVISWEEANRPLLSAIALERRGALLVIILIILIAAVNITTTLSLLVVERRLDIAVLRTCGASGSTIVGMFLSEGLYLSVIGTLSGCALGLLTCIAINAFGILELSAEVYMVSRIHLRPSPAELAVTGFCGVSLSLLASLMPAIKATMIKPVENLRIT